ncbi:DNA polymerase zeta catalytic subunit [Hondaea fermentalgiana]|uniref:DNA polymerase n=1 Tax=Hondaea fermentalgiana TaxID=2315210 RepID=A0A2R5GCL6_9STRA|nr:DNA polymerase zeta catalytic subunit [Hondaea fermentalgiana]|eukprot:GBG25901.1 DNA polymerase zeta catalytic subunit [Hondaea fermentalgiana]
MPNGRAVSAASLGSKRGLADLEEKEDEAFLGDTLPEILRVSILYLDYYHDDEEELPVLRIFGRKSSGDSLLVHIHNCMPYMFIKCVRGVETSVFVEHLKEVLADSKFGKLIFAITVCKAIDFYGYHKESEPETFVKIEITEPMQLKPLGIFLQSGDHKLARSFQPYETHIPYLLQFLSDYELAGMGFLRLADFETVSQPKRQTSGYPIGEVRANAWDIIGSAKIGEGGTKSPRVRNEAMHVPSLREEADDISDAERERDLEDHMLGMAEGAELARMTQLELDDWDREMSLQDVAETNGDEAVRDDNVNGQQRRDVGGTRLETIIGIDDADEIKDMGEDKDNDKSSDVEGANAARQTTSAEKRTSSVVASKDDRKRAKIDLQQATSQASIESSSSRFANDHDNPCTILRPRVPPPSWDELCADAVLENTEFHVKPFFSSYEDAAFERNEKARRMMVPARKLLRYGPDELKETILTPRADPPLARDVVADLAQCRGEGGQNVDTAMRGDRISVRVDKGTRAVQKKTGSSKISLQRCRVMFVEIIAATGTAVGPAKAREMKRMSNPKEDEILCIYAATYDDADLISDRHIFQAIGARLTSERMVLMEFLRYVRDQDPDILGGWEIQRRSLGYILQRAEALGIEDYAARLSRVPAGPQDSRHMNDAYGETEYSQIWLAGRHVFNMWRVIRKEIDLAQYTLEHVVQEFFGRPLPRFSDHYLHGRFRARATRDLAMEHLSNVVNAVHDVLMHLDVVTKVAEYAKLLGMDFFSAMTRGSQFQVEAVMVRVAKPRNFVMPSPSRDQVASQPGLEIIALNLEPVSNMYVDPVAVLDFRSLYPSVIISHNLCFSTFVGKVDKSGALVQEAGVFARHTCDRGAYPTRSDILRLLGRNEIFIAGNGACFLKKSVREGVLPCMLREILFTRFAIKDGLKKCAREGWDSWRRVLDARQLALKMLANVTYGYTAASYSGRMPMSALADAIVVTGKQALETSMREVQSPRSPWRPVCPSKPLVVYGDTDSLFVQLPNCKLSSAFHIAHWICEHMTMQFPHPMKLQFEKVYMPCMLVSKKRYCGLKYESVPQPGDPPARIESKGLENIRRDSCPIMKRIMNDLLESAFLSRDLSQTKRIFQDHARRILENKVSVRDFVFASKVRTPIEEQYKAGSYPPSVTVALRRAKADPMAYPVYKERVEYVIADGLPSARLADLVQPPRPGIRINASYYLKRKIIEPLQRLFRLVNVDVSRWYTQLRKAQTSRLPARSLGDASAHRDGVRAYFESRTCVICKRSYAAQAVQAPELARLIEALDTNEKICPARRRRPSSGLPGGVSPMAAGGAAAGVLAMLALGMSGSSSKKAEAKEEEKQPEVEEVAVVEELAPVKEGETETDAALEERVAQLEKEVAYLTASGKNEAFLFIKPHAVTDKVVELVKEDLAKAGVKIKTEGELGYEKIDKERLIDTHYGAIASKAVILKPSELNVPEKGQQGFKKMFGEDWSEAVKAGKVYNAADACEKLGISGDDLEKKWGELKRGENLIKFGGGFYCGKVEDMYIMNGFYLSMRGKYTNAPAKIHYFVVEWAPSALSWEDFRGKVLGGTDPKDAADGSLRRTIFEQWESLGLTEVPNVGDNGVHASASPFEASAERINWLKAKLEEDRFAKAALALGLSAETLAEWMQDAQVSFEGKNQSIFDLLEDMDTADVLDKLEAVLAENKK